MINEECITSQDIARVIKMQKQKTEITLKKRYFEYRKNSAYEQANKQLMEIETEIVKALNRLLRAGIVLVIPNENSIVEFNKKLEEKTNEEIFQALGDKKGDIYNFFLEYSVNAKNNSDNCLEIGKLNLLLETIGADLRIELRDAIKEGEIKRKIELKKSDHGDVRKVLFLTKLLKRVGIKCIFSEDSILPYDCNNMENQILDREIVLTLSGQRVWVEHGISERVIENYDELKRLTVQIQFKNAERQVRTFGEEEEKEYVNIQSEYLKIIKQHEELLRSFNEEEKECIFRGSW